MLCGLWVSVVKRRAGRSREIRSAKLETRNKLERQMIQTHRKRKTKPIGPCRRAKQSQCAAGLIGVTCYFTNGYGDLPVFAAWKTKPICGRARLLAPPPRGQACFASRNDSAYQYHKRQFRGGPASGVGRGFGLWPGALRFV